MSQDAHPDRAPVAIVGGGLAGSLSALYLARRGYAVMVLLALAAAVTISAVLL